MGVAVVNSREHNSEDSKGLAGGCLAVWLLVAFAFFLGGAVYGGYMEAYKSRSRKVEWKVVQIKHETWEEDDSNEIDGKRTVSTTTLMLEDGKGKVRASGPPLTRKVKVGDQVEVWQSLADEEKFVVELMDHRWMVAVAWGIGLFAVLGGVCMYRTAKRGEVKWGDNQTRDETGS